MKPHRLLWALALAALFCVAALPCAEEWQEWEAFSGHGGRTHLARATPRLDRSLHRSTIAAPRLPARPPRPPFRSGGEQEAAGGTRTAVRLLIHRFNE